MNRLEQKAYPDSTAVNYASHFSLQDSELKKCGSRLTQVSDPTESYTFDPVGNRLSSLGVSPYNNNASNQLTSTPSTTYTYDNNGNTATKVDSTGTAQYFWDFENRLTSVTLPGSGGTVTFKYDPFGRRIYKSSSSGTSIYAYDGDNLIEETNSSGGAVARYAQTENVDEPLAMLRSSTTSYYHADGLGSVTSLSNGAGALAQTYGYDSFGKQTSSSGSLTNPFRYTARESDTETGLYYYRARYYDQNAGRFLSEDPLGFDAGSNFYDYAANEPTMYDDPLGTCIIEMYVVPTGEHNEGRFYHAFLVLYDNSGQPGSPAPAMIFRGQPSMGTPPELEAVYMPLNKTTIDQPSDSVFLAPISSDSCSCKPFLDKLNKLVRKINNKHLEYGPRQSSNAATSTAIQELGFNLPRIPSCKGAVVGLGIPLETEIRN